MTKVKRLIAVGAIVLVVGATSATAWAASTYKTPAEAAAALTGKTVEQVTQEREDTGKTYGTFAKDAGKLDEFKKEVLEIKKDILDKQVAAGTITKEKANEILKAIEANQATCDGTGSAAIGKTNGMAFGKGTGTCDGTGAGLGKGNCDGTGLGRANGGAGMGRGNGQGTGRGCGGTCTVND